VHNGSGLGRARVIVVTMPSPARSTRFDVPVPVLIAIISDIALILAFSALGRDAHQRSGTFLGVLDTAWPFLAGAAASWLVFRAWRRPLVPWPTGVVVWMGALLVGMGLRALTGQSVVLPFVVVATITLGVPLLGYRLAARGLERLRSGRSAARLP
jgi:peptidoglycan/LPS O-acetylase OafA/YrhL